MRRASQKFLAGLLAAAMSFSISLSALPVMAVAADETTPLHLQDGWVVKKGDNEAADASQGSTSLVTVGGTEMTLITSGDGNGNGHFGSGSPEAFWMTDQADFPPKPSAPPSS